MNARGRISSKGQVVVPKDIRERLGLSNGREVEFVVKFDSVTIKPVFVNDTRFPPITAQDFLAKRFNYMGKSISIEDMESAIETEAERRWNAQDD